MKSRFHSQRPSSGIRGSAGFSLIELLVCVVIVSILTVISLGAYNGSLDQSDLKFVTPGLTRDLNDLRKQATEKSKVITVEFVLGGANYSVETREGSVTNRRDSQLEGILRRRIEFLRFVDGDGEEAPPRITFFPDGKVEGGTIYLGTRRAEHHIRIIPGAIHPSFIP